MRGARLDSRRETPSAARAVALAALAGTVVITPLLGHVLRAACFAPAGPQPPLPPGALLGSGLLAVVAMVSTVITAAALGRRRMGSAPHPVQRQPDDEDGRNAPIAPPEGVLRAIIELRSDRGTHALAGERTRSGH